MADGRLPLFVFLGGNVLVFVYFLFIFLNNFFGGGAGCMMIFNYPEQDCSFVYTLETPLLSRLFACDLLE